MTHSDPHFYQILGPYLAQRSIAKELGGPIRDDDGKVWVVALDQGVVQGFCAYYLRRETAVLCSAYVRPAYRKQGLYQTLFRHRLTAIGPRRMVSTVTGASVSTFRRFGFQEVRRRGRYTLMQREPNR